LSDLDDLFDAALPEPGDAPTDGEVGRDGVDAPEAVPDGADLKGWRKRRTWRRTERARRKEAKKSVRFPIITRSILVWWLIFALVGLSSGLTAAYFWTHFNDEIRNLKEENANLQETIDAAKADIETQRAAALQDVNDALKPLETLALESQGVALAGQYSESVWFVNTLDAEGAPSVGTAFVVQSNDQQSILLTSFDVVKEGVIVPGPEVRVSHAAENLVADVYSWDIEQDMALLVIPRPGLPALEWASEEQAATALGARVFVLSGVGGAGATNVPGLVVDQSAAGIEVDAPIGTAFRGGPVITGDGKVLGMASLAYEPLGYDPGAVRFAVPVGNACRVILSCGGGVKNLGPEGGPEPAPPPPPEQPAPATAD